MKKLLQRATDCYYKVRQVLESVIDCYYKVCQVLQSVTGCYYKVSKVLQSVTVIARFITLKIYLLFRRFSLSLSRFYLKS